MTDSRRDSVALDAPPQDTPSSLRVVGRGTTALLAGSGFSAAANFCVALVVARIMSQGDAGVFFVATSMFALIFSMTRLAVGVGLVKFIAEHRALNQPERIAATLSAGLVPVLGLSVMTSAALIALGPWLATTVLHIDDPSWTAIVFWASLIPFAAVSDLLISATRGFDAFAPAAVVERVARPGLQLVFVASTAALGADAQWTAVAWAAPYAISSIWTWLWLGRLRKEHRLAWSPPLFFDFWRFTWPRTIGVAIQSVLQRLDVLLLSALRSPAEAAVYVAASRYLVLGQVIGNSFSLSLQPRISRHAALKEYDELRALFRAATSWLILTSWPLFLSVIVFGPVLMSLFGDGYQSGVPVLAVLAAAMLVATAAGPVDQVLIMMGRPGLVTLNSLAALAVNVAVNLALIPIIGSLGAAIAWAASILISNVVPLWQVRRFITIDPFGRAWTIAALTTLLCWLCVPMAVRLLLGPTLIAAITAAAVGLVLYLLALRRWQADLSLKDSPLSFVATGKLPGVLSRSRSS